MTQKIIMVVDDEPDNRSTLKTILEKNKYKVVLAKNADECLAKLDKGEKPDLILLDIMMPGMPVAEAVKKIPKSIKVAYLSVVRMSDAQKEKLVAKNIVDYIQKPFDLPDLLAKVKKLTK